MYLSNTAVTAEVRQNLSVHGFQGEGRRRRGKGSAAILDRDRDHCNWPWTAWLGSIDGTPATRGRRAPVRPGEADMIGEYLDFQAIVGITKHMGGLGATRELLAMCQVERAQDVLEVGCGIGVGPANLALDHGCHVTGVDRSGQMIEWSRRSAREHGVADRVELVVADVTHLPFEDDRFDVAFAESVLAFVGDRSVALREMARVVRPGGYVGFNESIWTRELTPEMAAMARDMGADVQPMETWRSLCEESGLRDLEVRLRRVDTATEVRNRLRWVGLSWAVRAWSRTARLCATDPKARAALKTFYGPGMSVFGCVGYGLFAGRV
jgi:SAM-dependent methyltransferase